jgi:outer membrane biogenesis lipoprotein LolB
MKRITLVILMTVVSLMLFACTKTENTSNSNSNASKTAEKSMATPGTATTSTAASAGDKIGVPECDDFIAKYESCVSGKVPEMARAQYQNAVKQWKESWKKLAENPQTKGSLAAACKQAREQQEAALKSFGCTF